MKAVALGMGVFSVILEIIPGAAAMGIELLTEEQYQELQQLSAYRSSKGAVQFPLDQPIPYDLVRAIVRYRVEENLERAEAKQKKNE